MIYKIPTNTIKNPHHFSRYYQTPGALLVLGLASKDSSVTKIMIIGQTTISASLNKSTLF